MIFSKSKFFRRIETILSDRRGRIKKLTKLALAGTVAAVILSVGLAAALPVGAAEAEAKGETDKSAQAKSQGEEVPAETIFPEATEQPRGPELRAAIRALKRRDERIKTVEYTWEAKTKYSVKGVGSPAKGTFRVEELPEGQEETESLKYSAYIKGSKYRLDKSERQENEWRKKMSLTEPGESSQLMKWQIKMGNVGPPTTAPYVSALLSDVEPFLLAHRFFDPKLGQCKPEQLTFLGEFEYEGHPCIVVEGPPLGGNGLYDRWYLAEDRGYAPVLYETLNPGKGSERQLEVRVKLNYKEQQSLGWVLESWRISQFFGGKLGYVKECRALEVTYNEPIPDDTFRIDFPAGTEVKDRRNDTTYTVRKEGEGSSGRVQRNQTDASDNPEAQRSEAYQAVRRWVRDYREEKGFAPGPYEVNEKVKEYRKDLSREEGEELWRTWRREQTPAIDKGELAEVVEEKRQSIKSFHCRWVVQMAEKENGEWKQTRRHYEFWREGNKLRLSRSEGENLPSVWSYDGNVKRRLRYIVDAGPIGTISEYDHDNWSPFYSETGPLAVQMLLDSQAVVGKKVFLLDLEYFLRDDNTFILEHPDYVHGEKTVICIFGNPPAEVLWLAPEKNFALVKRSANAYLDAVTIAREGVERHSQFRDYGGGVHLPTKIVYEQTEHGQPYRREWQVKEMSVNQEIPDSEFTDIFPPGTSVRDFRTNRTYQVGE